jgi:hypothetical protein
MSPATSTLGVAALLVTLTWAGPAAASNHAGACTEDSSDGQTLRAGGKLVAARERFGACARDECPRVVRAYCARWFSELGEQTPSVVVVAQDSEGVDIVDARIAIDGNPPTRVDGLPTRLDPGSHTLEVSTSAGLRAESRILLAQGERERLVKVRLPPLLARPAKAPTARIAPALAAPTRREGNGPPTGAWIAGGLGVAGLAAGTYFWISAHDQLTLLDRPPPQGCAPDCSAAQTAAGRRYLLLGEVSFGVGGAGLLTALAWGWIDATRVRTASAWRLDVRPVAGGAAAQLSATY